MTPGVRVPQLKSFHRQAALTVAHACSAAGGEIQKTVVIVTSYSIERCVTPLWHTLPSPSSHHVLVPVVQLAFSGCLIQGDTTGQTAWKARWRHAALPSTCLYTLNASCQMLPLCSIWTCWLCDTLHYVFGALPLSTLCYLYFLTFARFSFACFRPGFHGEGALLREIHWAHDWLGGKMVVMVTG